MAQTPSEITLANLVGGVMSRKPKTLPERIKFTRNAWGWSQGTFSGALCCNQSSISFWEKGTVSPAGPSIVAIAALFGCTVDALKTGNGFTVPGAPATLPCFASEK